MAVILFFVVEIGAVLLLRFLFNRSCTNIPGKPEIDHWELETAPKEKV